MRLTETSKYTKWAFHASISEILSIWRLYSRLSILKTNLIMSDEDASRMENTSQLAEKQSSKHHNYKIPYPSCP